MAERKAVPHIYAEITTIEVSKRGQRLFVLSDGTIFNLAPGADAIWRHMEKGDLVLIDLRTWHDPRGYANIFAYRPRKNPISGSPIAGMDQTIHFILANDGNLTSPALDDVKE